MDDGLSLEDIKLQQDSVVELHCEAAKATKGAHPGEGGPFRHSSVVCRGQSPTSLLLPSFANALGTLSYTLDPGCGDLTMVS